MPAAVAGPSPPLPPAAPLPCDPGGTDALPRNPTAEAAMVRALADLDPAFERWARARRRRAMFRRLMTGVTNHFHARITEWFTAFLLLQLGLTLYLPPPAFPLSASWTVMARQLPEETWGLIMLAVAGLRIAALGINGTFRSFRYSPHVRCLTAFLACGLWLQVTFSIWQSTQGSTGFGTYRLILLLELWNVWRAGLDTGRAERGRNAR